MKWYLLTLAENCISEMCLSWSAISPYIIESYQDVRLIIFTCCWSNKTTFQGRWRWVLLTCTALSVLQRNCNQNKQPVGPFPVTRLYHGIGIILVIKSSMSSTHQCHEGSEYRLQSRTLQYKIIKLVKYVAAPTPEYVGTFVSPNRSTHTKIEDLIWNN